MRIKYIVSCLWVILLFIGNSTLAQSTTSTSAATTPAPTPTSTPTPAPAPAAAPAPKATVATATPITTSGTPAPAVHPRPKAPVPAEKPADAPVIPGPVWKKQITRDVEMGEKVDSNVHRLRDASPNNTLLEMFAIGIKTGKISSFYTSDFSMSTRINAKDFNKLFVGKSDTLAVRDASGRYVSKVVRKDFNYADVHKYRILEEWTSYPAVGKTEIQIVGIAPLKDIYGDDGTHHGVDPIFWVHYTDDIKTILARYDQYHPNNTLGGRLWDEYFMSQK